MQNPSETNVHRLKQLLMVLWKANLNSPDAVRMAERRAYEDEIAELTSQNNALNNALRRCCYRHPFANPAMMNVLECLKSAKESMTSLWDLLLASLRRIEELEQEKASVILSRERGSPSWAACIIQRSWRQWLQAQDMKDAEYDRCTLQVYDDPEVDSQGSPPPVLHLRSIYNAADKSELVSLSIDEGVDWELFVNPSSVNLDLDSGFIARQSSLADLMESLELQDPVLIDNHEIDYALTRDESLDFTSSSPPEHEPLMSPRPLLAASPKANCVPSLMLPFNMSKEPKANDRYSAGRKNTTRFRAIQKHAHRRVSTFANGSTPVDNKQ